MYKKYLIKDKNNNLYYNDYHLLDDDTFCVYMQNDIDYNLFFFTEKESAINTVIQLMDKFNKNKLIFVKNTNKNIIKNVNLIVAITDIQCIPVWSYDLKVFS